MFRRLIWQDFLKSRAVSMITLLFVTVAALLVSLAVLLGGHLLSAVNQLMIDAKTPHFVQMHTGELDSERMLQFAKKRKEVVEYQTLEFLNLEGSEIVLAGQSLAQSVQDNGLSTQSASFDYLLDLEGRVIAPSSGELYVPVAYYKSGMVKKGDTAVVAGKKLIVSGFVRDSQMNSSLASSKRFLVSEGDYDSLRPRGEVEYLIEFRLKDQKMIGAFEAAYLAAGLEANGPTITYPLFRLINTLSDGLIIAVLLLTGAIVIAISFLCIRFTLVAKLEEDAREIGVLKAIGLRHTDLKRLYFAKYAALAAIGALVGWGVSLLLEGAVLANIRLMVGSGDKTSFITIGSIVAVMLIFLIIIAHVSHVLRRMRKISAVEAIRLGTVSTEVKGSSAFLLSRNSWLPLPFYLGVKQLLFRKKLFFTMGLVVIASAFMLLVPQNLHHTISTPGFSTYMGIGQSDLLIRMQQTEGMERNLAQLSSLLQTDNQVAKSTLLTTKRFTARLSPQEEAALKIELGDHTAFPLQYTEGSAPVLDYELALSSMNAKELKKQVGDTLVLLTEDGAERVMTVRGIYSDITNGGKTAKAAFQDSGDNVMWHTVYVALQDGVSSSTKAKAYAEQLPFAKVADIDSYMVQTLGPTMQSLGTVSVASILIALLLTLLITLLMMKLLLAKERRDIAVLKALGITDRDIRKQYLFSFFVVLLAGIILGSLLANTLGEALAGAAISSLGADSFHFVINPLFAYLLGPLALAIVVGGAVLLGVSGMRKTGISLYIKE